MSDAIYPTLAGLAFPVKRSPKFKTHVAESASGREFRSSLMVYPRITYTLKYDFLSDADFKTIVGFFNLRRGSFESFKFADPDDTSIAGQTIGVGNGSTTQFQLVRSLGGFTEPVYDVGDLTGIYLDGVVQSSGYTISSTGLVTFSSAPTAGKVITWAGTYYWRVRFVDDHLDLDKFMHKLWQLGKVEFKTVKP